MISARTLFRRSPPPALPDPVPEPEPAPPPIADPGVIDIPVIIQSAEDRIAGQVFAQGRHMARQEEWCAIGTLLRGYDAARAQSPAGRPLAEILASGARSDAVEAGIAAANRGDAAAAQCPLDQLRAEVDALCCDHGLALVLARAHAEVGLAWRGPDRHGDHTPEARAAFHAHFAAAQRLVDRFDACEADAPSLAAMRCTRLAAAPRPAARILDDYADLIELDPEMPAHMRALGRNLLPSGFGTYDMLEDGARRIGAETADVWGAGGYAWVYLDALALDRSAFLTLDDEHFVAGLHDILAKRPGQETANLLAAFTGFSLAPAPDAPAAERRVASAFDWIVRDHLREVHATAWAAAPARTGPIAGRACMSGDAADRGAARALSSLGQLFADDLAAGRRVAVDATGWRTA